MTEWSGDEEVDADDVDYSEEETSAEEETDQGEQDEEPQLVYENVHEWVKDWLRFSYRRRVDGKTHKWCASWWQIDEALMRLEALWRAWEHLRLDPGTGMSVWWRDHADHHMPILLDVDGPFAGIPGIENPENTSKRNEPLAHTDAPDWLLEAWRKRDDQSYT